MKNKGCRAKDLRQHRRKHRPPFRSFEIAWLHRRRHHLFFFFGFTRRLLLYKIDPRRLLNERLRGVASALLLAFLIQNGS